MRPRRSGHPAIAFSLIELLATLSLMVLLMALLLPALGRSRAAARTTACLAQVRQFGAMMHMYAAESRGAFPGAAPGAYLGTPHIWWHEFYVVAGYYSRSATPVFDRPFNYCQETEPILRHATNWNFPAPTPFFAAAGQWNPGYSSYAMNAYLKPATRYPIDSDLRFTFGHIDRTFKSSPSRSMVLGDSNVAYLPHGSYGNMLSPFYGLVGRHQGGSYADGLGVANYLLGDGHARSVAVDLLYPDWRQALENATPVHPYALPAEKLGIYWYWAGYPMAASWDPSLLWN